MIFEWKKAANHEKNSFKNRVLKNKSQHSIKSKALYIFGVQLYFESVLVLEHHTKVDRGLLWSDALFPLPQLNFVVWDHFFFIVGYDIKRLTIYLSHFLMMTSTLNRTPGWDFCRHEWKHLLFPPNVFSLELSQVGLDKLYVFDGLHEIPHPCFFVAFLLMALPHSLVLLLPDLEKGFTRTGTVMVLSEE